jgi:prepilin-type N-terminal cleavage/methylation domain-containing protein
MYPVRATEAKVVWASETYWHFQTGTFADESYSDFPCVLLGRKRGRERVMTTTYNRLKRRREAGEINGFTLLEIMVVIVVLGILAAVVIYALGGITGKSAVAACQADGATVTSALSAYNQQHPNSGVTGAALQTALTAITTTTPGTGSDYIQSWPSNAPHYAFLISGTTLQIKVPATAASGVAYVGPSSCTAVQ